MNNEFVQIEFIAYKMYWAYYSVKIAQLCCVRAAENTNERLTGMTDAAVRAVINNKLFHVSDQ